MGRRQKYDIVADVLKTATGGTKKTRLVYLTNLNFTILKDYLKLLTENGLLDSDNDEIFTTWKGIMFLETYSELQSLFNEGENIEKYESKTAVVDSP